MSDVPPTDSALMLALKGGDMRALTGLIDRWERPLLKFIFRYVQNEFVTRDLVQETFIRVYQARDRFDETKPFSTWVFGIASNLCKNHYRWVSRHKETGLENVPVTPMEETTPADQLGTKERAERVAKAVSALPHRYRVAIILYYYEGFGYDAIAEVIGCSARGVESRLYRARKLLAGRLQGSA